MTSAPQVWPSPNEESVNETKAKFDLYMDRWYLKSIRFWNIRIRLDRAAKTKCTCCLPSKVTLSKWLCNVCDLEIQIFQNKWLAGKEELESSQL